MRIAIAVVVFLSLAAGCDESTKPPVSNSNRPELPRPPNDGLPDDLRPPRR